MSDVTGALADIPRLSTALAEGAACAVYIALVARRFRPALTVLLAFIGLLVLCAVHLGAQTLPLAWWIPGMLSAAAGMFLLLLLTLRVSAVSVGFLTARAFVLAEFSASLHWQLDRFYLADASVEWRLAFFVGCMVVVFGLAWLAERRHFGPADTVDAGWRELVGAVAIAAVTFGISNLSFVNANTAFSGRLGPEIFYIRTLVDLCGCIALYVQQEARREMRSRQDSAAMAQMLRNQHDQYEISRRAIDEVNRKYHDMKHHLDVLRAETDPDAKGRMLDDLEASIREYGARVDSGNRVVDAVLTANLMRAREHSVELTSVVDGALLRFLSPLDVTALLGNALDNALNAAARVEDADERLVRVAVFAHDSFVMLRVENTFDGVLVREGDRILSRLGGDEHGYGLRNIRAAAEKYGGSVSVTTDEAWFVLDVLLPRPR